jgi:hypothetical protein
MQGLPEQRLRTGHSRDRHLALSGDEVELPEITIHMSPDHALVVNHHGSDPRQVVPGGHAPVGAAWGDAVARSAAPRNAAAATTRARCFIALDPRPTALG